MLIRSMNLRIISGRNAAVILFRQILAVVGQLLSIGSFHGVDDSPRGRFKFCGRDIAVEDAPK